MPSYKFVRTRVLYQHAHCLIEAETPEEAALKISALDDSGDIDELPWSASEEDIDDEWIHRTFFNEGGDDFNRFHYMRNKEKKP